MMMSALAATAISTILIVALCLGDPKRRRSGRLRGEGQSRTARRLLVAATLLPGLWLALIGDAAAFLVWMGGCAAAGWFVTLWFSRADKRAG